MSVQLMSKINKADTEHLWLHEEIASGLLDSNYMELGWQLQNLTVFSCFSYKITDEIAGYLICIHVQHL